VVGERENMPDELDWRRIAEEIDAIRIAFKRRGYRVRKQAKQAAWAIYVTDDIILPVDVSTRSYQRLGALSAG
jgi:hypothetical protein